MPTIYLIRGLPGSGKSTFAYELWDSGLVECIFEADHYFTDSDGNYNFDAAKLAKAHKICQEKTTEILKLGRNVAVSNTSTTENEVETYAKIAQECNAQFVSIIVENRHGGSNIHNVPPEKIEQMKKRFSIKL